MSKSHQKAVLLVLITTQMGEEYVPFPSATRGLSFFNHVIFAAGLASRATHFPSCGTKQSKLEKNSKKPAFEDKNHSFTYFE